MTKPVTPEEIKGNLQIPSEVIEAFNELIRRQWDGHAAVIYQADLAKLIAHKMHIRVSEVFEQKYLDVEGIYRAAGWEVVYHSSAWNEIPFPPTFTFRQREIKW